MATGARAGAAAASDGLAASLSATLQVRPASQSIAFWDQHAERVWLRLDRLVSIVTCFFLPMVWSRAPEWCLTLTYIPTAFLKAWHLYVLHRASSGKGRYTFSTRNAFVVCERLLRMSSSYFMSSTYDRHQARRWCELAAASETGSQPLRVWLEVLRELVLGTGWTVLFWHAFCLPTVWALEGLLLMPLLLMSLHLRVSSTAVFLASFPAGSGVDRLKRGLAGVATGACRLAMPTTDGSRGVCELDEASAQQGGLRTEQHLVAALIIFVQYLAPLYFRYLQELSIKREFVWPHLDAQQRASFLEFRPTRAAWLNRLLKLYLHAVALSYILAVSLVLGRVAARHLARPPFHVLSEQCPI